MTFGMSGHIIDAHLSIWAIGTSVILTDMERAGAVDGST